MKEYIAGTGGRYTYADDLLNLQELALSFSSIFEGCSDFVISGCTISGSAISAGYVWLGGKIRHFEGCADAVFPYYLYETNRHESVVYAGEVNKLGRTCFLCSGSKTRPTEVDSVTGALPAAIELTESYTPRLIDKFFGRYALLTDTPFARQRIHKDLVLTGVLSVAKDISSRSAVAVEGENGYTLKGVVKQDGNASIGIFLNGLPVSEIILCADGSFRFMKQDKELVRITENGISFGVLSSDRAHIGAIVLQGNNLLNADDATDEGSVDINRYGFSSGASKYRDLNVYDGRSGSIPILKVIGKSAAVQIGGLFSVQSTGCGIDLQNTAYAKDDTKLTNLLSWRDSSGDKVATVGFDEPTSFRFLLHNAVGDIVLSTLGAVDVLGTLRVNGVSIADTYVGIHDFSATLSSKVDKIDGKQLSTEDFTTSYRQKLDAISTGELSTESQGYVTSATVAAALQHKLTVEDNLGDIADGAAARTNLNVYSKEESEHTFLRIGERLQELVRLTAEEINSLSSEEAAVRKADKQTAIRETIDAERRGVGEMKLAKAANLADVTDKSKARSNLDLYSKAEIDNLLSGKLGTGAAYQGELFTTELRDKLQNIKSGSFAYTDEDGTSHTLVNGYVMTSQVLAELKKRADRLLEGYNASERDIIAANLGVYTTSVADRRFAARESLFGDYITYLVEQGKTTAEAQQILCDKLNVLSKSEVTDTYLRRDAKLSDLSLSTEVARRQACRTLGAAYATDYQPLLSDTGWMRMSDSGSGTDTRNLFVRQIGSIVSIQGSINTAKRDGTHWGGIIAIIPNAIEPPKYSVRCTAANWNDDTRYNRGSTFTIYGGTRQLKLYESGLYNVEVELNFTYFV